MTETTSKKHQEKINPTVNVGDVIAQEIETLATKRARATGKEPSRRQLVAEAWEFYKRHGGSSSLELKTLPDGTVSPENTAFVNVPTHLLATVHAIIEYFDDSTEIRKRDREFFERSFIANLRQLKSADTGGPA